MRKTLNFWYFATLQGHGRSSPNLDANLAMELAMNPSSQLWREFFRLVSFAVASPCAAAAAAVVVVASDASAS